MRSLKASNPEQTGLGTCLHGVNSRLWETCPAARGQRMALGWETLALPSSRRHASETPPAPHFKHRGRSPCAASRAAGCCSWICRLREEARLMFGKKCHKDQALEA